MSSDTLDAVIHAPARLRIVATLAALPDGDSLSFTRLQDILDLTPGNLITHLRKLQDAGYLVSETTGNGRASHTTITLTRQGRTHSTPTPKRSANCSAACERCARTKCAAHPTHETARPDRQRPGVATNRHGVHTDSSPTTRAQPKAGRNTDLDTDPSTGNRETVGSV